MGSLPLDDMTVEEKLQTMEELWDALHRDAADLPSPAWHGEVLAAREAVAADDAVPEDWEDAKQRIRDDVL